MSKFIIDIERNTDIAESSLKKWQVMIFDRTQKALFHILTKAPQKRASSFEVDDRKGHFEEEGSLEYVTKQEKDLREFLLADSDEMNSGESYKQYEAYKNDRWVQKVLHKSKKAKDKISSAVFRKLMGDNTIQGWFARIGIFIQWRVVE